MKLSLNPLLVAICAATALVIGCTTPASDEVADASHAADEHAGHDHEGHDHEAEDQGEAEHGHTHGGWWCGEHGVPEEVCALCDSKVAAEFQKKGDWCKEHDRPDSQCFACHPELEAKFAAQYEAKYGEKPPKPAG